MGQGEKQNVMRAVIPILFWLLAIIHILPALSGLSGMRLAGLYGISAEDKTLMTLLQHRAVLFGIMACACVYAAYTPSVRWPVLIGVVISMASFLVIALPRGQMAGALGKIIIVDGIGLLIAAGLAVLMLRIK